MKRVTYIKLDGGYGRFDPDECESWVQNVFAGYDVFHFHRGNAHPTLFRTVNGTYIRRDHESHVEAPVYTEMTADEARKWLEANKYQSPAVPDQASQRDRKVGTKRGDAPARIANVIRTADEAGDWDLNFDRIAKATKVTPKTVGRLLGDKSKQQGLRRQWDLYRSRAVRAR